MLLLVSILLLIPVDALVMHGIFYLVLILILVFVVVTYVHIISALISVDALVMHGILPELTSSAPHSYCRP